MCEKCKNGEKLSMYKRYKNVNLNKIQRSNELVHITGQRVSTNLLHSKSKSSCEEHSGSDKILAYNPIPWSARSWCHCPNIEYYSHLNMGKKEGLRRSWKIFQNSVQH